MRQMKGSRFVYTFQYKYLFVFFHGGVQFLGKVIGDVGHPGLLLIGSAQAALVLARLFIVLLFGILAVSFCGLSMKAQRKMHLNHTYTDRYPAGNQCLLISELVCDQQEKNRGIKLRWLSDQEPTMYRA